jgi:peptidoglycan/xylan/chitin deacetylase (PgdA/CDA1 family)
MIDVLSRALDRRAAAGQPVQFWMRDDDAVVPSSALDQLLKVTGDLQIPLTLAVIPKFAGPELAERLLPERNVTVAVHGWAHVNHAGLGEKKQELGAHRPLSTVIDDLRRGFDRLRHLFPNHFSPVLVPPWNRIAPAMISALPTVGFQAVSIFGPETVVALPMMNTHVDLMDWRGTRGGRTSDTLLADLAAAVNRGGPVGFLTHHLVQDTQAWGFIELLFALTANHPGCCWTSLPELLQLPRFPSNQEAEVG